MQQYRDTNYAAVSAALHAREAHLLTQALSERMLEAPTAEESCKLLIECGYPPIEHCTLAKDFRKVAIPTNFMRRRILQCKTLEEACAILDAFEPGVSLNYVLASKTGDVVVYETTPVEHYKMYPSRGIVTQGNDIVANPVIDRFTPADKDHIHHFRGQRLNELLKMKQGEITTDYIQECLKDHYGYPGSICNHSTDKNLVTIASTMYCLNRG